MPNLKDAIHEALQSAAEAAELSRLEADTLENAKVLRFAWAEGRNTLYKFKTLSGDGADQVKDIIENSRLYFSTPDQFNDPLDCSPIFRFGGDVNDPAFIQVLQEEENKMIAEQGLSASEEAALRLRLGVQVTDMADVIMQNVRSEIRHNLRIFCLSSTNEHPLLWSHYGNSHTGVCLHFRVMKGSLFGLARAVEYSKARPPVMIPLRYNSSDLDVARAMSLVKADFWSYESEYRIIGHSTVDWGHPIIGGRYVSFQPNLLVGVSLGMCIKPPHRNAVLAWAAEHSTALPVFEAYEHPDEFAIKLRRLL